MSETQHVGLLCAKLSGRLFGIRTTHPVELLETLRLEALPCMPDCILGISNIRRGVAVVCDGRGLLCADDGHKGTRPVLVKTDSDALVLLFDAVLDFTTCTQSAIRRLDPPLQTGLLTLSEALPTAEGPVYIVRPEQLFEALRKLLAD